MLLNAAGCGLLAWVVVRVWLLPARPGVVAHVAAFAFAVCLPWLPGAQAAYDGFSLQLYTGLIALLFWVWLHPIPRAMAALPYLALAVGLFRPDGVLVGAGFARTAAIADPPRSICAARAAHPRRRGGADRRALLRAAAGGTSASSCRCRCT